MTPTALCVTVGGSCGPLALSHFHHSGYLVVGLYLDEVMTLVRLSVSSIVQSADTTLEEAVVFRIGSKQVMNLSKVNFTSADERFEAPATFFQVCYVLIDLLDAPR
jgi:hypothetical protein